MAQAPINRRTVAAPPPPPPVEEAEGNTLFQYLVDTITADGGDFPPQHEREDDQTFLARLVQGINGLTDPAWTALDPAGQEWFKIAGQQDADKQEITAPDGYYEEAAQEEAPPPPPPAAPARRMAPTPAAPAAAAPAKGAIPPGLAAYQAKRAAEKAAAAGGNGAAPRAPTAAPARRGAPAPAAPAAPARRTAPTAPAAPAAPGRQRSFTPTAGTRAAPAAAAAASPVVSGRADSIRTFVITNPGCTMQQLREYADSEGWQEGGPSPIAAGTLSGLMSSTNQTLAVLTALRAQGWDV